MLFGPYVIGSFCAGLLYHGSFCDGFFSDGPHVVAPKIYVMIAGLQGSVKSSNSF
jgi:hypothetical protein